MRVVSWRLALISTQLFVSAEVTHLHCQLPAPLAVASQGDEPGRAAEREPARARHRHLVNCGLNDDDDDEDGGGAIKVGICLESRCCHGD